MSTDLFVLYQTPQKPRASARPRDNWVRVNDETPVGYDRPVYRLGEEVKVVICEGDVFVSVMRDGKEEAVQRSYAAITTCHLCKLDRSFRSSTTAYPSRSPCIFCANRKESFHRVAEQRVRNCLQSGYQRMYGPFKFAGTAPFPFPKFEQAEDDDFAEIEADCAADLKYGRGLLGALRSQSISAFGKMGSYQQMILVRKFGRRVFDPPVGRAKPAVAGREKSVPTSQQLLERDERELLDLRIDLKVYNKVWAQVRRMKSRSNGPAGKLRDRRR